MSRRIALHLPRRTVRRRLTVLYGGVFVVSGAALLAITNLLVRRTTGNFLFIQSSAAGGSTTGIIAGSGSGPGTISAVPGPPGGGPEDAQLQAAKLIAQMRHQHGIEMHQLLIQSFIALAIMSVISIGLGWLVAGRALRPLADDHRGRARHLVKQPARTARFVWARRRAQGTRRHVRCADRAARAFVPVAAAVRGQRVARVAHTADVAARTARGCTARPQRDTARLANYWRTCDCRESRAGAAHRCATYPRAK